MHPVIKGLIEGLTWKGRKPLSAWTEENIILPREVTSMPGPLKFAPYQKAFAEAVDDPSVEVIVLMTSSQVGKSEFLTAAAAYFTVEDPSRILFTFPKDEAAWEYKKERIDPVFAASPTCRTALHGYLGMRAHDLKDYLAFPGGFLDFKGAQAPVNLAGKPIRVLIMDEVDRYPGNVGGEGDATNLAMKRTTTEHSRKCLLASTPKDEGKSRIERLYNQTDKRIYLVSCHQCGHAQEMVFDFENPNIVRVPGKGACYLCCEKECRAEWDQQQVKDAVENGYWQAQSDAPRLGWVGFHISELYSPFSSLEKVLAQWEAAEGDVLEEQAFHNTVLGRPWSGKLFSRQSPRTLFDRREAIDEQELPGGIGCLTAGVDVQGDRVEIGFFGWGVDDERWFIKISKLYGDVRGAALWSRVTEALQQNFVHHTGVSMHVEAVCVDAGFATQTVVNYVQAAREQGLNYFAIVGRSGEGRPLWQMNRDRATDKLYAIGIDEAKTNLYMNLAEKKDRPARVHLSDKLDQEMINQLVSENPKEEVNKRGIKTRIWELPTRRRNEALDVAVYAHAAFQSLGIDIPNRLEMLYGPPVVPADLSAIARSFHSS